MKKVLLASVIGLAIVSWDGASASAQAPEVTPAAVTCYAAATGAIGPTGPQGATGLTGATGTPALAPNGAPRAVHVRGRSPLCTTFAGICLEAVNEGLTGMAGPTGATGPIGDSGSIVGGGPRTAHVRGPLVVDPCIGIPESCRYVLHGPDGATGPVGDTGLKGTAGADSAGPERVSHRRPAGGGDLSGQDITLTNCNLPETGGTATSFLPYALLLLALGGVVVMVADRRRQRRPSGV